MKESSTEGVDVGNDELADMKQAVNTIRRKGLDQFEGQSSGYKVWFKLDIGFFKTTFSKIHSELYKELFKSNNENQYMEVYKTFIVLFYIKLIKKKY